MSTPQISVVVPTYKRPQLLKACVEKLLRQTLPADGYEVVVADDGDSQATRALVEDMARQSAVALRYVPVREKHGPSAARNTGWRSARAELIAFTDDDCLPDHDWLANGLRALNNGADAVWGRIVMPVPAVPTDYEKDASNLAHAEFVTANCFCRRALLERVGGFDERFRLAWREDSDLFFNFLELGVAISHEPLALVVHPIRRASWGVSLSQQRKVVFDALLYRKHPQLFRRKIRSQPPWHYYASVLSMFLAILAAGAGAERLALLFAALWLLMTARFFLHRMNGTARTASHVAEMLVTSVLIPPLALFWHWVGVWRFRTLYL